MLFSWFDVFNASLQGMWLGVADLVPKIVVAFIVAIIGWALGALLCKFVSQVIKIARIDNALRATGLDKVVERAGFKLDSGMFIGKLVEWFVVVLFLVVSFDILGLKAVTDFLSGVVLGYLPRVIIASLFIIVAAVVAEAVKKVIVGSAKAANVKSANFAGNITKWAVWTVTIITVLGQLGVVDTFINTLFTGVIIAASLALGLAFGLGGQDAASKYIMKLQSEMSDK